MPRCFDAGTTGGQPWEPKNYDGKYDGPMTMRTGLAKSKNMISIRILQSVGPKRLRNGYHVLDLMPRSTQPI